MPVIGLTDTIIPSLPRIGQLRKGAKAEGNIGREIEWFRFVGDEVVTAAFVEAYEAQPRFLAPVFLPYRTPEENFAVWKEAWGKSGLMHRCDGKMTTIIRKGNVYSRVPEKCPGECDLVGRLTVILPGLWKAGHVGYVTVNTGAVNDVVQILALLKTIYEGRQDLRGIAFQLRRVLREVSAPKPNSTERMRVKKWLVQLEVAPDWARLQLEMAERQAKMIEAPARVIASTGEVVDDLDDDEAHWTTLADAAEEMDLGEDPEIANEAPPTLSERVSSSPTKREPKWTPEQRTEFTALVNANHVTPDQLKGMFDGPISDVEFAAAKQVVMDMAATRASAGK